MYQRILVPIDGSATAARGLAEAIALGRLTGARLQLVHVIDELSFARRQCDGQFSLLTCPVLQPGQHRR